MVSAIVQKTIGLRVTDFLRPRLFDPLNIPDPAWETDPRGIDVGGWGLSLRTEEIARFGQLYLQNGVWNNKRLLPEAWVEEATAAQVSNGEPAKDSDWSQGYGYQFWRCRHNAYRGDGAFGQFCVVLPDQQAVLAITAGTNNMQAVLNLVWEHLLPALQSAPLPKNAAVEQLTHRLANLALAAPRGSSDAPLVPQVSGKTYQFAANDQKLQTISFDFGPDECAVIVRDNWGEHRLVGRYGGAWRDGTTTLFQRRVWPNRLPRDEWRVAASGAWVREDTFDLRACFTKRRLRPPYPAASPITDCRSMCGEALALDRPSVPRWRRTLPGKGGGPLMTLTRRRLLMIPAALSLTTTGAEAVAADAVPRFGVFEATFTQAGAHPNPYTAVDEATATLTPPNGDGPPRTIPLFWDGGPTWKLRFSPDTTGTWRWAVRCPSDKGLDGKSGAFRCVPSQNRGSVQVMPAIRATSPGRTARPSGGWATRPGRFTRTATRKNTTGAPRSTTSMRARNKASMSSTPC
jgi:hypothetical protein